MLPGRAEAFEKQRQEKGDPGSQLCDEPLVGGGNPSETKVVSLSPDKIFQDIKDVSKSFGDAKQLVAREPEEHDPTIDNRGLGGGMMVTGLHPGNTLLGQETREEEVLGCESITIVTLILSVGPPNNRINSLTPN